MYSRSLARLPLGTFVRRSFSTGPRNAGQRQQQQSQWSRAKFNFGRVAGTGVATVALSGGLAFVLHASTAPEDNKKATPSKVDYWITMK